MNETRPSILCRCATVLFCLVLAAPAVAQEDGESEAAGAEQTSEDELSSAREYEKLWELEKAAAVYEKALDVARDVNWFNSYAKKAAERLTTLDPEAFPDMSETLGHRLHRGTGFDPPGFSAPSVPEPSPMPTDAESDQAPGAD